MKQFLWNFDQYNMKIVQAKTILGIYKPFNISVGQTFQTNYF